MRELPRDYIGGFFDGEGCATIVKKRTNGYSSHMIHVSVSQNTPDIIRAIQNQIGGGTIHAKLPVGASTSERSHYTLIWSCRAALYAVQYLIPVTIIKRPQLLILERFYTETMSNKIHPQEKAILRQSLIEQLQEVRAI